MRRLIAVIGNGDADDTRDAVAAQLGATIVRCGFGVVCGGLGGVMQAACRGAKSVDDDALTVAILPGGDRDAANPYADVVIPTGLGYARNLLVVLSAEAVVAVGGASGTLSEMAHAWQLGKPLCGLGMADGWAARLAGTALDSRRDDLIHAAATIGDVEKWLRALPADAGGDLPA